MTGRVTDARTKKPIPGVWVLYGACGTKRARTDSQGRYRMTVSWGDVYLHTAHRAYEDAEVRFHAAKGSRVRKDLALNPKKGPLPKSVHLDGRVEVSVYAKGTRSEYRKVVLKPAHSATSPKAAEIVLFDVSGCTYPLASWAGKWVHIQGYWSKGSVGWMHRPTQGIIVERIVQITPVPVPRRK